MKASRAFHNVTAAAGLSAARTSTVAANVLNSTDSYSATMLHIVGFKPDSVHTRHGDAMVFPWTARRGSLNGFNSVHGGALSSLASAFTQIHARAASPSDDAVVESISFEISFLSAVFEDKECSCITRVEKQAAHGIFTNFSFEDASTGEVYARGTHVLAIS